MLKRIFLAAFLVLVSAAPISAAEPFGLQFFPLEGAKAFGRGDLDGALNIYGQCLDHPETDDTMRIACHMGRMRVYALQERFELALADTDAADSLANGSVSGGMRGGIHAARGMLLGEMGRRAEAIAELENAETLLQDKHQTFDNEASVMKERRPDLAEWRRKNAEALIRNVKEKLDELRSGAATP